MKIKDGVARYLKKMEHLEMLTGRNVLSLLTEFLNCPTVQVTFICKYAEDKSYKILNLYSMVSD